MLFMCLLLSEYVYDPRVIEYVVTKKSHFIAFGVQFVDVRKLQMYNREKFDSFSKVECEKCS